ncbi:MAG: molecular chaperone DnaK [Myxococcaceae bacterium]
MADREPVIGIDLGTTNSVVATVQGDQPVLIKNRSGHNLTPSVVAVSKTGKRLVGQIAKRQAITNPEETVYAGKRLIGRKFSSELVQKVIQTLPYRVVSGEHDDIRIMLGGKPLAVPEISAQVLMELKADAEQFFGKPLQKAVITVPAYFNDGQRQATKDAGKIAGLDVLRILNEPTAASLAYGFGKNIEGKIAVYDLGGGTFDISVLEVSKDVFDVIATGGDTYLGGEDFDARIIEWLVFGFAKEHGVDLRKDRMALQRLKDAAENAKIQLSSTQEAQINLPFLSTPPGGSTALHLQTTLARAKLEELTADLCDKTIQLVDQVLKEAKVRPVDLREIILVGGMTRMPRIVESVKAFFKRDPCKGVHPEEVVALGAAIQANTLVSGQNSVLLLDVTPQSLGVAIAGGYVRTLIAKNTTVPTAVTELFNTSRDGQTVVKIMVLQGESEIAHENELLGEFQLSGLREAPRGEVEIEVTFDINSEGIMSVSARDKETGQKQSITVTASGGLTEGELQTILEAQKDYLLEARSSEELSKKKADVQAAVDEIKRLLGPVQSAAQGSDVAAQALAKANEAISAGEAALRKGELKTLAEVLDVLSRTANVLKGLVQRLGDASR